MQVFEIKTNRSDYPYIVIADGFKKAIEMLYDKSIYDSNIIFVRKLEDYKSDHILLEDRLTSKEEIRKEVLQEWRQVMPQWKRMPAGIAGGADHDTYLIRSSRGHYFTSSCLGGDDYYLELESLEQLSGLPKEE